jgi:hypothetical protein
LKSSNQPPEQQTLYLVNREESQQQEKQDENHSKPITIFSNFIKQNNEPKSEGTPSENNFVTKNSNKKKKKNRNKKRREGNSSTPENVQTTTSNERNTNTKVTPEKVGHEIKNSPEKSESNDKDQPDQLDCKKKEHTKDNFVWSKVEGIDMREVCELRNRATDISPVTPEPKSSNSPPYGAQRKIGKRKLFRDRQIKLGPTGIVQTISLGTAGRNLPQRLQRAKTHLKSGQPIQPPAPNDPMYFRAYGLVDWGKYSETKDPTNTVLGFDSMADVCVWPTTLLPRDFKKHELKEWKGNVKGLSGHSVDIIGVANLDVNFSGTNFTIPFLITENDGLPFPLVGSNMWKHAKIRPDYEAEEMVLTDPNNANQIRISLLNPHMPIPLRTNEKITIPKSTGLRVDCAFQWEIQKNDKISSWCVERTFTTTGALTLKTQLVNHGSVLGIFLENYDTMDVTIEKGALVAQASLVTSSRDIDKDEANHGHTDYAVFMSELTNFRNSGSEYSVFNVQADNDNKNEKINKEDLTQANIGIGHSLEEEARMTKFLSKWVEAFAVNPASPQAYKGPKFRIDTQDAIPVKDNPRRCNPWKEKEIAAHVEQMVKNGIAEESRSPWASPVVLAKKKDGSWRFCVDYRKLNSLTRKDAYPLPRIDDLLDALGFGEGRIFSTLDVASGYWHIPIADEDKEKTAFTTNSGLYQFRVLPFGLTGAPGAFCRAMTTCLRDLLWKCALVYVDDIIVWSKDIDTHEKDLSAVFSRLVDHGFQLKLSKCSFFQTEVEYLGFEIGHGGVAMSHKKVEAILKIQPPRDLKALQTFLGMMVWYRRFIKNYSIIAAPLTELTGKPGLDPANWHIHE